PPFYRAAAISACAGSGNPFGKPNLRRCIIAARHEELRQRVPPVGRRVCDLFAPPHFRREGKATIVGTGWGEGDNPMSEDHVKYDSQLIQKFADRLYAEANRVVIHSTVVATMVGIIAGYVIAVVTHVQTIGFVLVCAVVAWGMGYVRGR